MINHCDCDNATSETTLYIKVDIVLFVFLFVLYSHHAHCNSKSDEEFLVPSKQPSTSRMSMYIDQRFHKTLFNVEKGIEFQKQMP